VATYINGVCDDTEIANKFMAYFEGDGKIPFDKSQSFATIYHERLTSYTSRDTNNSDIDVELIERLIRNTDRCKAASKDLLTCEHLLYCHPMIIVTITKLFK